MLRVKESRMKDLEKYGFTLQRGIYSKIIEVLGLYTVIIGARSEDGMIYVSSYFGGKSDTITDLPNVLMEMFKDGIVEVDGHEI